MVAFAPACPTCGAVLTGYGRSEDLNFQVHFCLHCRAKSKMARAEAEKQAVRMEVMDKAA
jgi:hypothetical protein